MSDDEASFGMVVGGRPRPSELSHGGRHHIDLIVILAEQNCKKLRLGSISTSEFRQVRETTNLVVICLQQFQSERDVTVYRLGK